MERPTPHRVPTAAEMEYSNLLEEHKAIEELNKLDTSSSTAAAAGHAFDEKIVGAYLTAFLGKTLLGKHKEESLGNTFYRLRSFYASGSQPAYDFGQTETSLKFTFRLSGATIPPEGIFVSLGQAVESDAVLKGKPWREKAVTFVSACCRAYDNRSGHPMAASFNAEVTHKAFSSVKNPVTQIAEDLGGLKGASVLFEPSTKKRKDQFFLHVQHVDGVRFHYTNPDFIKQTFRVEGNAEYGAYHGKPASECTQAEATAFKSGALCNTNQSLWNGIIRIPSEVCKSANLPLYDERKALEAHFKTKQLAYKESLTRGPPGVATKDGGIAASGDAQEDDDDDGGIMMMDTSTDGTGSAGAEDPYFVTEEERKQSIFLNVDDDKKIRCWYLIPHDHLLSWPLTTTLDQRQSAGVYALRLHAAAPAAPAAASAAASAAAKTNFLCGYLVPDNVLRGLIRSYESRWQNRVDVREDALNTVGFTVAPSNRAQGTLHDVNLEFTVHCQCIFWNQIPNNVPLAPKLHPKFPPFVNFVRTPFDDDLGERLQALSLNKDNSK